MHYVGEEGTGSTVTESQGGTLESGKYMLIIRKRTWGVVICCALLPPEKEERKTTPGLMVGLQLLFTQPYLLGICGCATLYEV